MAIDLNSEKAKSTLNSVASAVSYICVSIVMTLLNKHIISKMKFPGTNFLLFSECVICSAIFYCTRLVSEYRRVGKEKAGKKKDDASKMKLYTPFDRDIAKFLFVCTLAKAVNMYFSFLSMKYTSLPVYNVLKRMNPIAALLIDFFVRSKTYNYMAQTGLFFIACGAVVTGSGDMDFEIFGYMTAMIAVLGQASYLVLSSRAMDKLPQVSSGDVTFYTGFYNMFLFLPLMLPELSDIQTWVEKKADLNSWESVTSSVPGAPGADGKPGPATEVSLYGSKFLLGVFVFYSMQGILLNYVTFWCNGANSPVTTGVSGNVKGLLTSLVAVFVFSVNLTTLGWSGVLLNSCGSLFYVCSKLEYFNKKKDAKAAAAKGGKTTPPPSPTKMATKTSPTKMKAPARAKSRSKSQKKK